MSELDASKVRRVNHECMNVLLDYRSTPPSRLARFLWRCAGADEQLLLVCTHSEHVTYAGLGAFVLITGILAALTGGYALFTVFRPAEGGPELVAAIVALFFGVFWGLMIFNLDRYIVASSGKGDGKESISLQELKNAAPRLVLALVIGLVMSTPLELRLFKKEIDVALASKRQAKIVELNHRDSVEFAARGTQLDSTIRAMELERRTLHNEVVTAYGEMRDEGDGIAGTSRAGAGPRYATKKKHYEDLAATEQQLLSTSAPKRDSLLLVRETLRQETVKREAKNAEIANEMGGIVDRIRIVHEQGGWIAIIVRVLIMLLEIIPVLSKLMYRTGPYDILQEHLRLLIPARLGVSNETHDLIVDGRLITRSTELFPMAQAVHSQASDQLASIRERRTGIQAPPDMGLMPSHSTTAV